MNKKQALWIGGKMNKKEIEKRLLIFTGEIDIEDIKKTQQELLQQYSKMVKVGGQLVYATCSVLPSENQEQVHKFLASDSGKSFTFIKENKKIFSLLSHLNKI